MYPSILNLPWRQFLNLFRHQKVSSLSSYNIFAPSISSFFVPGEIEVINSSALFIRIMALSFGFIGIQMVISGTLKAAGKTTLSMSLSFTQTISLFIAGFLLSIVFKLGAIGIWIAYPISNLIGLLMALYLYRSKTWLTSIV
ncbi:hypothetical protein H6503_04315 [Candidatus Woesearchaeota archaeon]|nr:hypothetical protein [Candidatus Woesearchaeota archaeon]